MARALARSGRAAEAVPLLADIRRRGYGPASSITWDTAMSCVAEAAAICGDATVASDLLGLLEPLGGHWISAVCVWDSIDRVRALCLLTAGEPAGAATLARAAAAASKRKAAPILRARELIVAAAADAALARPTCDELLREAFATARSTGARIIEHDARLLLGSLRVEDDAGLRAKNERSSITSPSVRPTGRSPGRCTSARQPSASTSNPRSGSSASRHGPRPPHERTASRPDAVTSEHEDRVLPRVV